MRFMMMIKANAESEAGQLPSEELLTAMGRYNEELIKAGALLSGDGLQASSKGARVRIAGGKTKILDGPFAEAKELIAGFWMIKASSKAEALEWARRVPTPDGEIEIREIYEMEDFAVEPTEKPDGWRDKEAAMRAAPPPARVPGTTRWALLLKADKNTEADPEPKPSEKLLSEMGALMEEMGKAGALLAGEGLKPSRRGAKVRFSGGKAKVIDGPFTESKEIIAGFSICQTKTREEALDYARRMLQIHVDGTGIGEGEVEVRRFFELEDFPQSPEEKPGGWRDVEQSFRDKTDK